MSIRTTIYPNQMLIEEAVECGFEVWSLCLFLSLSACFFHPFLCVGGRKTCQCIDTCKAFNTFYCTPIHYRAMSKIECKNWRRGVKLSFYSTVSEEGTTFLLFLIFQWSWIQSRLWRTLLSTRLSEWSCNRCAGALTESTGLCLSSSRSQLTMCRRRGTTRTGRQGIADIHFKNHQSVTFLRANYRLQLT